MCEYEIVCSIDQVKIDKMANHSPAYTKHFKNWYDLFHLL